MGAVLQKKTMQLFNELQLQKSIVAEKMAEAVLAQAEDDKENAIANKEKAAAKQEKAELDKVDKYMQLIDKDTSDYDDAVHAAKRFRGNQS